MSQEQQEHGGELPRLAKFSIAKGTPMTENRERRAGRMAEAGWAAARGRPVLFSRRAFVLPALALALLAAASGAACTPRPTPYQPLGESGGYEETRLQENVYRVSFKANPSTAETTVLDYLYLRCAELTQEAGYSHFLIVQDFGKSQTESRPRARMGIGLGFFSGARNSFWSAGASAPLGSSGYERSISYHLGFFVIRMLKPEQAREEPDALEVAFLLKSLEEKLAASEPSAR